MNSNPTPETDALRIEASSALSVLSHNCWAKRVLELSERLERERDEAREMLKISTSGEVCQDCGVNMSPSLIESGSCIFCIQKQTAKERDEARQQIHDWIVSDKRTAELNQLRKERDEWKAKFNSVTNYICLHHTDRERGELVTGCPICKLAQLRHVADMQNHALTSYHMSSCSIQDADEPRCDCGFNQIHENADAAYDELPHVRSKGQQ